MCLISLCTIGILGIGYRIALQNLGKITGVTTDPFHYRLANGKLVIQTGSWIERLSIYPEVKWNQLNRSWQITNSNGVLTVLTQPYPRFRWENLPKRRSSNMNGEY